MSPGIDAKSQPNFCDIDEGENQLQMFHELGLFPSIQVVSGLRHYQEKIQQQDVIHKRVECPTVHLPLEKNPGALLQVLMKRS